MPTRPVLFLPGYYGSKFKLISTGETIWIDLDDIFRPSRVIEKMALGQNPDPVKAVSVLDTIDLFPFLKLGIYKSLERWFRNSLGYAAEYVHMVPVDWRQSLDLLADQLKVDIETRVPNGQVDLVGHSHGGLVARAYMAKYGGNRVARLITLGTPHKGMLKVLEALASGIELAFFTRTMTKPWARSMPSPYELMPRFGDGHFLWNGQATDPFTNADWVQVHESNPAIREEMLLLLQQTQSITAQLLPNQIPVPSYFIFGTRLETMNRARGGPGQPITMEKAPEGDGVVTTLSAEDRGIQGANIIRCPAPLASHMLIFRDAQVKALMKSILLDDRLPYAGAQVLVRWEGNKNYYFPGTNKRIMVEVRDLRGDPIPDARVDFTLKQGRRVLIQETIPQSPLGDFTMLVNLPSEGVRLNWRVAISGTGVPDSAKVHRGSIWPRN